MHNVFVMWRALELHRLGHCRLDWRGMNRLEKVPEQNEPGMFGTVEYMVPVQQEGPESRVPKVCGTVTRNQWYSVYIGN